MSRMRLEFTVGEDLLARLDAARGREPRASFARWALEQALAGVLGTGGSPRFVQPQPEVPARVSDQGFSDAALERQRRLNQAKYR